MERAGYRIVDANFNRAREAARVVEEHCRFALNSAALSERAKQPRHDCGIMAVDYDRRYRS
jgi:thiamine-phosphate pyrophosphorylase